MKNLKEIVEFYLTTNTSNALMVTGEWGTGKTYYFKNILSNQIITIPTYNDNSKNYKPILISLFGLKSLEEIQTEILLSLIPILKDGKFKLGASIFKSITKGILNLKGLGEITKYVEEIKVNKNIFLNFDDLVLCFDDLERISDKLKLDELIGYINSLVENDKVKIIIIANEDKITAENYSVLKEKVIGNSIEFISNIEETYDSIIEDNFNSSFLYLNFLKYQKEFIIEIFTKKSFNLRILNYCLTYFQNIFSEIQKNLTPENILKDKEDEILKILLNFSIAVSIEYKLGNISFSNRQSLNDGSYFNLDLIYKNNIFPADNELKELTFKERFNKDYFDDNGYIFFNSVYDFITGGSIIEYEMLLAELNKYYNIEENKISEHYEVYNNLGYQNCFKLDDKKYLELTKKLINYSDKGLYDIQDYLTVFYFVSRFNNPLNFKLENLEKRIIKGMLKGKASYRYTPSLDFNLIVDENSQNKIHLINIREEILALNNQLLQNETDANSKNLEIKCYENFKEFYLEILRTDKDYFYKPFMADFNDFKFYKFFLNSDNETKWLIIKFLPNRYKKYGNHFLKLELNFYEQLVKRVESKCRKIKKGNLTGFLFLELEKALKDVISILKEESTT